MKKSIIILLVFFLFSASLNATTWYPTNSKCPVCKEKSEYQVIASYGSYIYNWPEKYQYVYWPLTDSYSIYCCPNCHFSAFMWDFDSVPQNKIDTLKSYLSTTKLQKKIKSYIDIPTLDRLEIAENVYKILGKDKSFWCQFYRVFAYHEDIHSKKADAKEHRLTALEIARQMLTDTVYSGQEKENLYIIAAMHNFTENQDSALIYLDKASLYTYTNPSIEEDYATGLDNYLTNLIDEYKEMIKNGGKFD